MTQPDNVTTAPPIQGSIVYEKHFPVTEDEERLLIRLRQLRRKGDTDLVLVDIRAMTLRSIGLLERLAR